jgi:ribosomal protein L25 (general stress protein Ctc)
MNCAQKPIGATIAAIRSSILKLSVVKLSEDKIKVTEALSPSVKDKPQHLDFPGKTRLIKPESPLLNTLMLP